MFERFNTEARSAIVLAQEQARSLGHNYIGTEHLLLALLFTGETTAAGQALQGLGVSHEQVRSDVLAIVGPGEGAAPGHIPFTPRSKKVLELSLREALRLKHKSIGPEHILLGMVREGEGLAAQILTKNGVDLDRLRQEVTVRVGGEPGGRRRFRRVPDPRATAMTAGAVHAAEKAMDLAGGEPIASQHYLLGVLDDENSAAAKALAALGVTRDAVEAKLAEIGTAGTSDDPPGRAGARRTRLDVEGDVVEVRLEEPEIAHRLRHLLVGRGVDIPGLESVWRATLPAITNVIARLESAGPAPEWSPPGWAEAGAATYAVISEAGGPVPHLWTAEGVDEAIVARWLSTWLTEKAAKDFGADECTYLSISLGRITDVVPNALDREGFLVSNFSCGIAAPHLDRPRRPAAELVDAALADLSTRGDEPPG